MEKFEIYDRLLSAVQFTAEIDCDPDALYTTKIGLAVQWANQNGTDMSGTSLRGPI